MHRDLFAGPLRWEAEDFQQSKQTVGSKTGPIPANHAVDRR